MEITKTERKGNLKSGRMLDLWEGIAQHNSELL